MLFYNHVFNTNLDHPYHVHIIDSDTTSVAVNINGVPAGYFKPTHGHKFKFSKTIDPGATILELITTGSKQTYNRQLEQAIFKESNVRYVFNNTGKYLVYDTATDMYYWSDSKRSRFFFNPFYFNSIYLWKLTLGYVPSGTTVADVFEDPTFFSTQNILVGDDWSGYKSIPQVEPIPNSFYSESTIGLTRTYSVDHFIEELQDLKNGDILTIDNGKESIEVMVDNCTTEASYPKDSTTTRPIIHVPIDIVNPNKRINYSKTLEVGEQKTVKLDLYGNSIKFNISRN